MWSGRASSSSESLSYLVMIDLMSGYFGRYFFAVRCRFFFSCFLFLAYYSRRATSASMRCVLSLDSELDSFISGLLLLNAL